MPSAMTVRVAATGEQRADTGERYPAGEAHGWRPGENATVCGVPLHRARLSRFAGVSWDDVQPAYGGRADYVQVVCRRCAAAIGGKRPADRRWRRVNPRP